MACAHRNSNHWLVVLLLGTSQLSAQQLSELPGRDQPLRNDFAVVFTIGAADGQSWEMLSGVSGVAFDRADNLYVVDARNTRVLVFDARGKFLRQIARKGRGPGEFEFPGRIVVTANDQIIVNDQVRRVLVIYSTGGQHIRDVQWDGLGGSPHSFGSNLRSGLVALVVRPGRPDTTRLATVLRFRPETIDRPTRLQTLELEPMKRFGIAGSGAPTGWRTPVFSEDPMVAALPDGGVALQNGADYRLAIVDSMGRHERTITRPIKGRKVTKQDEQAWDRRRIAGARAAGFSGPVPPLLNVPFAAAMSVVTGLRADPAGRIWVQRRKDDATEQGPIDLLTATGRYIGTLPPQSLPGAISASGLAAWIIRDELGVERVSVKRLPAWN